MADMNSPGPECPNPDWRKLLAAYADGELAGAQRRRVEAELELNPQVDDELAAQNDFSPRNSEFWSLVETPLPSAREWERVWRNVERGVDAAKPRVRQPHGRWWRRGLIAAIFAVTPTAAAAVAVGIALDRPARVEFQPVAPPAAEPIEEFFTVAKTDDVEILSIRDADQWCLVVGESPFTEPINLAGAGDVRFDGVRGDWEGQSSQPSPAGGAGAPMIFPAADRKP
jgi:hypothetical protein